VNSASQQIVNKAWKFPHVLRDDGLSYMAYTEQITFLLFLKIADDLPSPNVLAQEIADDLQTALEQLTAIAEKVKGSGVSVANGVMT
jgi:hypothetical protein